MFLEITWKCFVEADYIRLVKFFNRGGEMWVRVATESVNLEWEAKFEKFTPKFLEWCKKENIYIPKSIDELPL